MRGNHQPRSRVGEIQLLNIALWIVQGLLALTFLGTGAIKTTQPIANIDKNVPSLRDFPPTIVRLLGVAEILGVLGLLLPGIFHVATILTPIAAIGLAIVVAGAAVAHLRLKEYLYLGFTVLLVVLALVVAIGRFTLPLA
jgi:hypothetical protein